MTGTSTKLTDRIQAQALKIITGTGTIDHDCPLTRDKKEIFFTL
jgi:hypothetical protein